MRKCQCSKCFCSNEVKEFGHRFEEENALVEAEYNKDTDKIESIVSEICQDCVRGQHGGQPKNR